MITEADVKRINELYHKSQNEGLTEEEKDEQQRLRKAYVGSMRANVRANLDNIVIQRPDGTKENIRQY